MIVLSLLGSIIPWGRYRPRILVLVVVQFEFFRYSNHLQIVISKGVSEPRVFISGRVALRDLVFACQKQKVPRPYSGAEDGAPSLTGSRDDDLFDKDQS
jgi:hypothetical protein